MNDQDSALVVDPASRTVSLGGETIDVRLSPQEFDLLAHLAAQEGVIVTREDLCESVWGSTIVDGTRVPGGDEHMLHALVHRTRTKFRNAGVDLNSHLMNVPGVGYRFTSEHESGNGDKKHIGTTSTATAAVGKIPLWAKLGAALAAGVAIAAFLAIFFIGSEEDNPTESEAVVILAESLDTAGLCGAEMLSPEPGTALDSHRVTFKWSAGCGVTKYDLWVGCTPGANDFFDPDDGNFQEALVTGLPTDGGPIYVSLTSSDGTEEGTFVERYTYTAAEIGDQTVVEVAADTPWFDTGVSLSEEWSLGIDSCGQVAVNSDNYPRYHTHGDPECAGLPNTVGLPAPDAPCWSLIGRIGENGEPFLVGQQLRHDAVVGSGTLYLAINDDNYSDNSGSFRASIVVDPSE